MQMFDEFLKIFTCSLSGVERSQSDGFRVHWATCDSDGQRIQFMKIEFQHSIHPPSISISEVLNSIFHLSFSNFGQHSYGVSLLVAEGIYVYTVLYLGR